MRARGILIIIGVVTLFFSCNTEKNISQPAVNIKKVLNERDQQYYYYTFLEANRKKLLGDLEGALSLYYSCLEINPTSAAAMSEIAGINEIIKNYDVAVKYAVKAVETDDNNKWYKLNLAKLYIITNNYPQATSVYEKLYEQNKGDMNIAYNLAALYTQVGNYKNAIELYDVIEKEVGLNENLSIAKQQLYMQLGNRTKAYEEINNLVKAYPEDPRYYGILAEMYTNENLFLKAEENYKKLFEIDSTNALGQLSIIDFYRKKMDYDNAFKTIKKVIYNDNIEFEKKVFVFVSLLNNQNEVTIYGDKIKELLLLFRELNPDQKDDNTLYADYLIKTNQFDKAKEEIEYIINTFGGNTALWEQLLSIYSFNSNFNELYNKSQTAIDSFPDHALFYLFKGIAASQIEKEDDAISALKSGLKLAENNQDLEMEFYTYLGEAYNNKKEYVQSDYYFEQVLKKQPNNLYVINNYSYYLSLRGDKLDYAESISKKTVQAEPNNSTYLDTYAWILYKLGRYQDALVYIKRAFENGGANSEVIVDHYGDIKYKTGDIDAAVELWKMAKDLGNTSNELENKIQTKQLD